MHVIQRVQFRTKPRAFRIEPALFKWLTQGAHSGMTSTGTNIENRQVGTGVQPYVDTHFREGAVDDSVVSELIAHLARRGDSKGLSLLEA
eukprot:662277-Rhodomonas_salina.1